LEGKKTELNRTEINRFEPVFGSVRFKKLKKKFGLVIYFDLKPDRTENAQPYTSECIEGFPWFVLKILCPDLRPSICALFDPQL
jgi:hypothetical protein